MEDKAYRAYYIYDDDSRSGGQITVYVGVSKEKAIAALRSEVPDEDVFGIEGHNHKVDTSRDLMFIETWVDGSCVDKQRIPKDEVFGNGGVE